MKLELVPFEQASYLSQIKRLRVMAEEVVKKFPIKVKSIVFIRNNANAVFKITDVRNKKYCLRIHPPGFNTKDAILEELKWINLIAKSTDILVAKPIYTNEGEYLAKQTALGMPGFRYCDMLEWLDGKFLWKGINTKYAYNLGLLMGRLQDSGKKVRIKDRLHYWDADALVGTENARCKDLDHLSGLSREQQKIITSARRFSYQKLKEYETGNPEKSGLIHGDLNPNNIIIRDMKYGAIDFDNCGMGLYGVDLATPLIAFEHLAENEGKNFYELKEALFLGYSEYMPLSQSDIHMSPYFLLALKLHTIGWLELKKDNPRLRPWFLKCTERAIAYFKSNKFMESL